MIEFLIRRFVPDWQQVQRTDVRERYGTLAAAVGILSNIFLCIIKGLIGLFSGSIAVTADAVNNLSDAGSSVITLLAFKIAGKPADEEHPYGHARMEYISGMAVSFIIILLGLELMGSSFEKILHPEEVGVSALTYLVLIVSIAVKLWQGMFNRNLGKRISSEALQATAADSLNDVFSTGAVLLSTLVYQFTAIPIDGWVGMLVAIFITVSGVKLIMETGSPLLGQAPDPQMVRELEEKITAYDGVIGIHDLQVHNYGPGRVFATVHAEVPANRDILVSHDIIDNIERDFQRDMGIQLVIHLDPVVTGDERTNKLREQVGSLLHVVYPQAAMHDFRVVWGVTHSNVVFDVAVPFSLADSDDQVKERIAQAVSTLDPSYRAVVTVDRESTVNELES